VGAPGKVKLFLAGLRRGTTKDAVHAAMDPHGAVLAVRIHNSTATLTLAPAAGDTVVTLMPDGAQGVIWVDGKSVRIQPYVKARSAPPPPPHFPPSGPQGGCGAVTTPSAAPPDDPGEHALHCELCGVHLTSAKQLADHYDGSRHKRATAKAEGAPRAARCGGSLPPHMVPRGSSVNSISDDSVAPMSRVTIPLSDRHLRTPAIVNGDGVDGLGEPSRDERRVLQAAAAVRRHNEQAVKVSPSASNLPLNAPCLRNSDSTTWRRVTPSGPHRIAGPAQGERGKAAARRADGERAARQ
jgi:hypothetical protein